MVPPGPHPHLGDVEVCLEVEGGAAADDDEEHGAEELGGQHGHPGARAALGDHGVPRHGHPGNIET